MIRRKEIYDAHRARGLILCRHSRHSSNILSRVSRQLDKHQVSYILDYKWPYHLIAYMGNKVISIYSGGWSNLIETLPLKKDGNAYTIGWTRSFKTPEGTVNYLVKKYGNPR